MDWEEEYHRGKVLFSPQHIKVTYYEHDLKLLLLIKVMAEVVLGFIHSKVTLFSWEVVCSHT